MAVVGDIFRLEQKWERDTNVWYNVYHYAVLTAPGGGGNAAEDLVSEFVLGVEFEILDLISTFARVAGYKCQSLTDPSDFYEETFAGGTHGGDVASEALPEQWTLTLKCYRPFPPLRNGYKRFGGVAEAVVSGDTVEAAYIPQLNGCIAALGADLTGGPSPWEFRPMIVPGEYEDGTTPAAWRANRWQFARMGTQRTRMPA